MSPAPLVYVNYGMPDDYKALERMGVDVKGKIVIARYGAGWRGLKPKLAQDHGAVGCIIYSDPADDGYSVGRRLSEGRDAPAAGLPARLGRRHDALSRRSADARASAPPKTPSASTREATPTILKIPALPISYGDAQVFLPALGRARGSRRLARRTADHLSRRRRARRDGAPRGQVRLEPEDRSTTSSR